MELDRFHELSELLKEEYESESWTMVENLALEYLALAEKFTTDLNYGNAIHHANLVLGKIRLKNDDLEKAKDYLLNRNYVLGFCGESPKCNKDGYSRGF